MQFNVSLIHASCKVENTILKTKYELQTFETRKHSVGYVCTQVIGSKIVIR